jgi:hypothetical protein
VAVRVIMFAKVVEVGAVRVAAGVCVRSIVVVIGGWAIVGPGGGRSASLSRLRWKARTVAFLFELASRRLFSMVIARASALVGGGGAHDGLESFSCVAKWRFRCSIMEWRPAKVISVHRVWRVCEAWKNRGSGI